MYIDEVELGQALFTNEWMTVDQEMINRFANATGDHQWIHVDQARCKKESPYKTTIAHGFLTASLMPNQFTSVIDVDENRHTVINYGLDNLRFITPVKCNDEIRFCFELASIEKKASGARMQFNISVEIKGSKKLALKGEFLILLMAKKETKTTQKITP